HSPIAGLEAAGSRPQAGNLSGQLQARNVLRRPGRRGIKTASLEHVRPVEPGGADPDQHLAGPGLRVWMVLDLYLLIADGDGPHWDSGYPRTSWATHSIWGVCGNMSTGWTRSSV